MSALTFNTISKIFYCKISYSMSVLTFNTISSRFKVISIRFQCAASKLCSKNALKLSCCASGDPIKKFRTNGNFPSVRGHQQKHFVSTTKIFRHQQKHVRIDHHFVVNTKNIQIFCATIFIWLRCQPHIFFAYLNTRALL